MKIIYEYEIDKHKYPTGHIAILITRTNKEDLRVAHILPEFLESESLIDRVMRDIAEDIKRRLKEEE